MGLSRASACCFMGAKDRGVAALTVPWTVRYRARFAWARGFAWASGPAVSLSFSGSCPCEC